MTEVLVCGSAVVDMIFDVPAFPRSAQKHRATAARIVGGGCAGNAAVAIARLGGRPRLAARMGADLMGRLTREDLDAAGVDTALVQVAADGQSAFSSIYVDPAGERQIVAFRGAGLAERLDGADLGAPAAVLADTRWPAAAETVLRFSRARDIPGVLDGEAPVTAHLGRLASHVAFSAQGLRAFAETTDLSDGLRRAQEACGGWVCVTDGAHGTYHMQDGEIRHTPALPVEVVDTLGAGDVWHGAFTLRLAEGADEAEAIRFASAAAAIKCTRPGGRAGAPGRAETEEMMRGTGT